MTFVNLIRLFVWGLLLGAVSQRSFAVIKPTDLVTVPAGDYVPVLRAQGEPARIAVLTFQMEVHPVTNAQFLDFVRENPKWRRSEVSRLFADDSYLKRWAGDLELGASAPPDAPVTEVSWFAARAYAASLGRRLPTIAEWERAASFGYRGSGVDPELRAELFAWLAAPTPQVLAGVGSVRPNHLGLRGLFGLVWEWVDDFTDALIAGDARSGPDKNAFCGGGAIGSRDPSDYAAYMRLALRSSLSGASTTTSLGFRCVADSERPSP